MNRGVRGSHRGVHEVSGSCYIAPCRLVYIVTRSPRVPSID